MSNQTLVSVVIIFFNAERFIQEAINSVFAQNYKNWELLLVDDGSSDGSTMIARQCAKNDPRVRYLEHQKHANRGMSASRNHGIDNAQGAYVAFLDADDVWFSNILEEQVAILEAYPQVAMVYGPIQWWYSWTGLPNDLERDYVERLGVPPNAIIEPPKLLPLFLRDMVAVPSGILVRRVIINRLGGFEDSFKAEYEDQVFCAKICLSAPVFASGRCWYRYRQHADSRCSIGMITGEFYSRRPIFLNWLEAYMFEREVKNAGAWQALRTELWPYRHPIICHLLERRKRLLGQLKGLLMPIAQRTLPVSVRRWLNSQYQGS